jgi:hypothetical protein
LQEMRRPWKVVFGFGVSFGTALGSEPRVPHMPGKLLPWKVFFCLFVFVGLRLELRASHLQSTLPLKPHLQSNCSGYFGDGVLQTICLGWTRTMPITALWGSSLDKFLVTKEGQLCLLCTLSKEQGSSQAPVAHTCNPSYSRGRDQEDQSLKPARVK